MEDMIEITVARYDELVCAQATLAMLLKLGVNMKSYEFAEVIRTLTNEEDADAE